MESILYIIAGLSSFIAAYFFGRHKWDGLLQWLLVFQNLLIGGVMIAHAFEFWGWVNSDIINLLSGIGFILAQSGIAIFLYLNMKTDDDTFKNNQSK